LGPDGTPDGWLRIRGELLLYARGDREGAAQVAERLATLRIGEALSLLGEVQDEGRLNALVDRRPFLKPFKWHQAFAAAHARRSGTPAEKIAAQELVARIDGWHLAGLNGLAEELLEQRKPAEALVALRKLRRAWPEPGAAFLLLFARSFALEGRAQEQLGARAAALAAYDHFLGLWKDADADLPELINAKARVEALRGGQPLR
jgi:hypothetical protein